MCNSAVGIKSVLGHNDSLAKKLSDGTKGFSPVQGSFLRADLKKLPPGIYIDRTACNFCGACVQVCDKGLFMIMGDNVAVKEDSIDQCPGNWNCGACVNVCAVDAITIAKQDEHKVEQ